MISEGLKGAFSLLKMKRQILWLGDRNELPPKEFSQLLGKVRFVPFGGSLPANFKNDFPVLVVSLGRESKISDKLLQQILNGMDNKAQRFLAYSSSNQDDSTKETGRQLVNQFHFNKIFEIPKDYQLLGETLNSVLEDSARLVGAQVERRKVRNASQALESKTTDLEDLATDRNRHLHVTKKEIEIKVARIRKLIRFLKDLSTITSVEDLLTLIRQEIKIFHQVKDPILVFHNSSGQVVALYLQGPKAMSRLNLPAWPQVERSRLNDSNDSQYLANTFGRPFAKVLAIPLSIQRNSGQKEMETPGVLYLEHSLDPGSKIDFLQFVEERLPALSIALDRVFLEGDMTEASLLWERTFDGISDPVAIFDADGRRVRANRAFQDRLAELNPNDLFLELVKHGDRIYEVQTYPINGGIDEIPTNIVVHYVDVTLAHQLQKRMIQQEKMAALGHLAGHVAHELNNPLTGIRSLSQVMISQLPAESAVRSDLVEVEKATERCQVIIKNLLEFSKGGVENRMTPVDLTETVKKTLPLLKTMMGHFNIENDLSEEALTVVVEPQLLQQVIFNLIKNACQAMKDTGTLGLVTKKISKDNKTFAVFEVSDTGVGISAELLPQIFEFFYTTKERGQGTGLGLSMSKSIIESFAGTIRVESKVGKGSRFSVELPLGSTTTDSVSK